MAESEADEMTELGGRERKRSQRRCRNMSGREKEAEEDAVAEKAEAKAGADEGKRGEEGARQVEDEAARRRGGGTSPRDRRAWVMHENGKQERAGWRWAEARPCALRSHHEFVFLYCAMRDEMQGIHTATDLRFSADARRSKCTKIPWKAHTKARRTHSLPGAATPTSSSGGALFATISGRGGPQKEREVGFFCGLNATSNGRNRDTRRSTLWPDSAVTQVLCNFPAGHRTSMLQTR